MIDKLGFDFVVLLGVLGVLLVLLGITEAYGCWRYGWDEWQQFKKKSKQMLPALYYGAHPWELVWDAWKKWRRDNGDA